MSRYIEIDIPKRFVLNCNKNHYGNNFFLGSIFYIIKK